MLADLPDQHARNIGHGSSDPLGAKRGAVDGQAEVQAIPVAEMLVKRRLVLLSCGHRGGRVSLDIDAVRQRSDAVDLEFDRLPGFDPAIELEAAAAWHRAR